MRTSERIINEVAQEMRSLDEAVGWFSSLDQGEQDSVLREIVLFLIQSHVTADDGREGLARSEVKATMTPAILILREPILEQIGKIASLPPGEYLKAFRVLLSTFAVADTRRRETVCRGSCSHAWHNLA
ncbi:DUF5958 family protein [Streptomyces sp. NPDC059900]|uniref:DUF5958 family protein n=1 Tax=Streptomyces sp. NPDC059900 TaxID=3155816 RepID=UPI003419E0C2